MSISIKHLAQFQNAKKGIELLFQLSKEAKNYDELQSLCDTLASYFSKSQKDQAPNKNLILFQEFGKNEQPKKRDIETMRKKKVAKNTRKKSSHFDYISEYQTLRERGYSYQKISLYSEGVFKVKVSRETIRNILIQGGTK